MQVFAEIKKTIRLANAGLMVSVFSSSLFLNACAVGPDYRQPAANLPDSFANGAQAEFSDREIEHAWWKLFNDQQLVELIDQTARQCPCWYRGQPMAG